MKNARMFSKRLLTTITRNSPKRQGYRENGRNSVRLKEKQEPRPLKRRLRSRPPDKIRKTIMMTPIRMLTATLMMKIIMRMSSILISAAIMYGHAPGIPI